jgi:agmatine deiminase
VENFASLEDRDLLSTVQGKRRLAGIRIPADWEPYKCCWMAWAVHREWGTRDAAGIKQDLTKVVHAIARFEPVRLMAPPGHAFREASKRFSDCSTVTVIEAPVEDFWMRDIMPTFAIRTDGSRLTCSIGSCLGILIGQRNSF